MDEPKLPHVILSETATDALLLEYAVTGDQESLSILLGFAQRGNPKADAILEKLLCVQDPVVLIFLVERAKVECAEKGECPAFYFLWRTYQNPIFKYLYHLVDSQEIGYELAQETFLHAWLKLASTNDETKRDFKAWLYRIAHNLAMDYLKHPRLPTRSLNDPGTDNIMELPSTDEPEESIFRRELIQQALDKLTHPHKQALLIEVFQNQTQREKANLLGITESTFSSRVSRARKEFKEAYENLSSESRQEGQKHGQ